MFKIFKKSEKPYIKTIIKEAQSCGYTVSTNTKEYLIFKKDDFKVKVYKSAPWIFHEVYVQKAYPIDILQGGGFLLI